VNMRGFLAACLMAMAFAYSEYATAQEPAATEIAPPRNGLRTVPLPRLDDLEPAVSDQIREQQRAFRALVASGSNSGS